MSRGKPPVQFVTEKVSGKVHWKERKIAGLIDKINPGDVLIVPELSRLGRSLLEILEMLSILQQNEIAVFDIRNGWTLDGGIESQAMACLLSIAAQLERQLLLQRCEEGRRAATLDLAPNMPPVKNECF